MSRPGASRAYASPLRRERADATRRAILTAAEAAFGQRGYVATTVAELAHAAGVAPETVYAVFGTKLAVLSALVDRSIAGDDEPDPILNRSWVAELASEPDLDRRIARLAHGGAAILARRAEIDEVVAQAAGADVEAATLLERMRRDRWAGQRRLLEMLLGPAGLPNGRSLDRKADALFAIGSPEVYRLLVVGRAWTHAAFEAWYASAIQRMVVAEIAPPVVDSSGVTE